jgi:hypothetical protein
MTSMAAFVASAVLGSTGIDDQEKTKAFFGMVIVVMACAGLFDTPAAPGGAASVDPSAA